MVRVTVLVILAALFISTIHAEVSLPWEWSKYTGTSQWKVIVTEDETGCNGGITDSTYTVAVEHTKTTATIGDFGHGKLSGTFEGNIFHIQGRTIPDGSGTSKLSSVDFVFSPDCSSFSGKYSWDYSDSYGSCSGTTSLSGTNTKGGCPALTTVPVIPEDNPAVDTLSIEMLRKEISDARQDLNIDLALHSAIAADNSAINDYDRRGKENNDPHQFDSLTAPLYQDINNKKAKINQLEPGIEAKYKNILDKDPYNFWANWDMAELKKQQGKYDDFYNYFDNAASNKNQFEGTKNTELEKNVAADLGLSQLPTTDNSNVVKIIHDETGSWTGGMMYNVNVPESAAKDTNWGKKLFTTYSNKAYDLISTLAGLPGDK